MTLFNALQPAHWLMILALTQAGDAWTTLKFLSLGVQEANPLILYLVKRLGSFKAALTFKGLAVMALGMFMLSQPGGKVGVAVLIVVYVGVIVWNLRAIARAQR